MDRRAADKDPRLSPEVLADRIEAGETWSKNHEVRCDERHRAINDTLGSARAAFKVLAVVVPIGASAIAGLVIYIHNGDREAISTATVNGQNALTELYTIKGLLEGRASKDSPQ